MQILNIPLEHSSGEYKVSDVAAIKFHSLELRRLDNDIIEYDHPVTGRLVRIYDVADKDYKRMKVRYSEHAYLEDIILPMPDSRFKLPWKTRLVRTVYQHSSDSDALLLGYGDILCDEVVRPLRLDGGVVSRLFVESHYDEIPALSVILASPEDVQKYSADYSGTYPGSMRHHADDEFVSIILAGTDDPVTAFNKYVTYTTDAIIKALMQYQLTTPDFRLVKEEYD